MYRWTRRLLSPEAAEGDQPAPAADQPTVPTPSATEVAGVASPAVTPAPTITAPTPPEVGELPPDQLLEVPGPDGGVEYMRVDELVKKATSEGAQIPGEELEKFILWKKASAGDPDALRSVLEGALPRTATEAAPEPGTPEARMLQLEQTIGQLQQLVTDRVMPITDQIRQVGLGQQIKTAIDTYKTNLPYLAKLGDGGVQMVQENLPRAAAALGIGDMSQVDAQQQVQVFARALTETENRIKATATAFGGWTPQTPKTPQPTLAVDDQTRAGQVRGKAQFTVGPNGQLIDRSGQPVVQQPHGQIGVLPGEPPGETVTGQTPPLNPQATVGKYDRATMTERMRIRKEEINPSE